MSNSETSIEDAISHERPEFARAIRAVITADPSELRQILAEYPRLVKEHSRSDHRATLLHYIAANGIEDALQTSPKSIYQVVQCADLKTRENAEKRALSVARVLLNSGAEIDAAADAYDGGSLQTPLNWLVSSDHPAAAGLTGALTELFCKAGASVDGVNNDSSPVFTALGFGHTQAVKVLFDQGAVIDNILLAAASGQLSKVKEYWHGDKPEAGNMERCKLPWLAPTKTNRQAAELALVLASMCGHNEIVRYLIAAGIDKNAIPPGTHMTAAPLHTACLAGEESTVDVLIELECDPTLQDPRYRGDALGWAKHGGNPRIIRKVGHYLPEFMRRQQAANPAVTDFIQAVRADDTQQLERLKRDPGLTPEHMNGPWFDFDAPAVVAFKSNLPLIECLVDAGADINQKSLWWAGGFGVLDDTEPELAEQLMARGAKLDVWSAAGLDKLSKLQAIVQAEPALVHARGPDGKTPLHCAKSVSAAKFLLSKGADINAKCIDHESTPAQYLVADHPEVVRALIQHGCAVDSMLAAALGDNELLDKILHDDPLALSALVDSEHFPSSAADHIYAWKLGWYATPHQVAQKFGHDACVQFLFQRSPPGTQLLNACLLDKKDLIQALRSAYPNLVEELPEQERRYLAHAARNNQTLQVRNLLAAGFPVDVTGQHGATALHWAAFHGNAEMVRWLLQYHPPLDARDDDFDGTPIDWALQGCQHGWYTDRGDFVAVIRALIAAGCPIPAARPPTGNAEIDALFGGS